MNIFIKIGFRILPLMLKKKNYNHHNGVEFVRHWFIGRCGSFGGAHFSLRTFTMAHTDLLCNCKDLIVSWSFTRKKEKRKKKTVLIISDMKIHKKSS